MNLIQFENYDAYLLYQEYLSIPDNPFAFDLPEGMILTVKMIHTFVKASYHCKGDSILES